MLQRRGKGIEEARKVAMRLNSLSAISAANQRKPQTSRLTERIVFEAKKGKPQTSHLTERFVFEAKQKEPPNITFD
jgi:hypothetical protein